MVIFRDEVDGPTGMVYRPRHIALSQGECGVMCSDGSWQTSECRLVCDDHHP
jgi:hypothetical protein